MCTVRNNELSVYFCQPATHYQPVSFYLTSDTTAVECPYVLSLYLQQRLFWQWRKQSNVFTQYCFNMPRPRIPISPLSEHLSFEFRVCHGYLNEFVLDGRVDNTESYIPCLKDQNVIGPKYVVLLSNQIWNLFPPYVPYSNRPLSRSRMKTST